MIQIVSSSNLKVDSWSW